MQKIISIFFIGFGLALGCGQLQLPAIGDDDEILVFADSSLWTSVGSLLRQTLEVEVLTPQPEKMFHLRHLPLRDIPSIRRHRNVLLVGTLDGEGEVAQYIRSALSADVRSMIEAGTESIVNKYDVHARGQIMMFLAAPDVRSLEAAIREKRDELYYFFENAWLKREIAAIRAGARHAKKDIEREFLERYGWRIFVQHDYRVAIDSASERFVWLRRATPADMERWVFVHWIEDADPRMLSASLPVFVRNLLTRSFFLTVGEEAYVRVAEDPVSREALRVREVNFLGRFGYETVGLWQFSDLSGGGPFINYTFYDEPTQRIYMIDGSIFAPRYEKKKLIMQVRALAHTFQTAEELTLP